MVDSSVSMHMMSKRDVSSEQLDEEAQVYVHDLDLDLFVIVQLFEDVFAFLSRGKL